jgi:predicted ribosome quality control (RQC) complex YloA/Tae2 family protein
MTFDTLALHAVRDELEQQLRGGRVQQVFPISSTDLGLEVYAQHRRRHVLFSIDPLHAGVHLVSTPLRRATEAVTPFLLLLRKYVRGGWMERFQQPRLERVLSVQIASRQDDDSMRHVELVLEAMGRRSNLLLVDEDAAIMDAMKRLPPARNPSRPLLPHLRYTLPPPQERLDPLAESTIARLREAALTGGRSRTLAELLTAHLAGCSPQLARELAYRTAGSTEAPAELSTDWGGLRQAIHALYRPLEDGAWQPTLVLRGGRPIAFAPYLLTHLSDAVVQPCASMSQAIEAYLAGGGLDASTADGHMHPEPPAAAPTDGDSPATRPSHVGTRSVAPTLAPRALLDAVARRREQLARKREALGRALTSATDPEALRTAGDAILASAASIELGQEALCWEGRIIPLDPTLDPIENAQRYFRDYRKARDAAEQVPALLQHVENDLTYLDELSGFLARATDPAQLRMVQAELAEIGVGRAGRSPRRPKATPGKRSTSSTAPGVRGIPTEYGQDILLGMSAHGNQAVTFEMAQADDVWLHARGVPGAHVVIRTHGAPAPTPLLERAAKLAAAHSAASGANRVQVDWTLRRYVKRRPGGRPGQVTYTHEQTILVEPTP